MSYTLLFSGPLDDCSKAVLPLWIFFVICVFTILSCLFFFSLVVTYWERVDLLALLSVMFSCVFDTFPYSVLGQVCCLVWFGLMLYIPVNSYSHVRTVSSPNHTFFLGKLEKAVNQYFMHILLLVTDTNPVRCGT